MRHMRTVRPRMAANVLLSLFILAPLARPGHETLCIRRFVAPEYPWLALIMEVQGDVHLVAEILPDGSVKAVSIQSGAYPLTEAAKDALSRWLFTGCHSQRTWCSLNVVFSFVLKGKCRTADRCPVSVTADLPDSVRVESKKLRDVPIT